jgi:hypothetical protein
MSTKPPSIPSGIDLRMTAKMDASKDVLPLLDKVWPELQTRSAKFPEKEAHNRAKLREDYAVLVEFLTDKEKVIEALRPLDQVIAAKLQQADKSEVKAKVDFILSTQTAVRGDNRFKTDPDSDSRIFKTHKILSGALDEYENPRGFNAATTTLSKLHTSAQTTGDASMSTNVAFDNTQKATWTEHNPKKLPFEALTAVPLPKGTPTISGILKKSFNPILLKNGFHWKDPGADSLIHGEFTHRFQWYAIGKAVETNKLTLANTPVQIFKSMGYQLATGQNYGQNVYLWEMICDNFDDARSPKAHQPHSGDGSCFTCPDFLNRYLSKNTWGGAPHELPYLNLMMRARYLKRAKEQSDPGASTGKIGKPVNSRGGKTKNVGFGITSPDDEQPSAIWWVKHS